MEEGVVVTGRIEREGQPEPGDWRYNGEEGGPPGGESQPREKPLRGAE